MRHCSSHQSFNVFTDTTQRRRTAQRQPHSIVKKKKKERRALEESALHHFLFPQVSQQQSFFNGRLDEPRLLPTTNIFLTRRNIRAFTSNVALGPIGATEIAPALPEIHRADRICLFMTFAANEQAVASPQCQISPGLCH